MKIARAAIALLLGCCAAAQAQQSIDDLAARTSRKVMESVDRLPKYVCTQTIERRQYQPVHINPADSCERLAAERLSGSLILRLVSSDRLRLDVATATDNANREMYSWVGKDRFEDRTIDKLVRDGTISNGNFSTFLHAIFAGNGPVFFDKGDVTLGSRRLHEIGFTIPFDNSNYYFGNRRTTVKTAYGGSFTVDPLTAELVRLVIRAGDLPPATDACEVTQTLDYSRVQLNNAEFLLPRQTVLQVQNRDGTEMDNSATYANCHEFRGESKILFAPPPSTSGVPPRGPSPPPITPLPPLLPFRLALTVPVDTATAATGDPVHAKLTTAIRDKSSRVFVPAGAAVNGRIMQMLFSYGKTPSLKMEIRWESLVSGGLSQVFAAEILPEPRQIARFKKQPLAKRVQLGTLRSLANSDAGVFNFEGASPGFVVPAGMESSWFTAIAP